MSAFFLLTPKSLKIAEDVAKVLVEVSILGTFLAWRKRKKVAR